MALLLVVSNLDVPHAFLVKSVEARGLKVVQIALRLYLILDLKISVFINTSLLFKVLKTLHQSV